MQQDLFSEGQLCWSWEEERNGGSGEVGEGQVVEAPDCLSDVCMLSLEAWKV